MMRQRRQLWWLAFVTLSVFILAGCGGDGDSPTGPETPPQLLEGGTVSPNPANPGADIILSIPFVDVTGTLNGGIAYITDSQGNSYEGLISNATGTSGTLNTTFQLSVLVQPGEVMLTIFVKNQNGQSSSNAYISLTVS